MEHGKDVRDWFYAEGEPEPDRGKVGWSGVNARSRQVGAAGIRLYDSIWANAWTDKKPTIEGSSRKGETVAAPLCVAMTVELR